MSKKTTETKTGKQAEKKQPTELKDDQLDEVQGGGPATEAALNAVQVGILQKTKKPAGEAVEAFLGSLESGCGL